MGSPPWRSRVPSGTADVRSSRPTRTPSTWEPRWFPRLSAGGSWEAGLSWGRRRPWERKRLMGAFGVIIWSAFFLHVGHKHRNPWEASNELSTRAQNVCGGALEALWQIVLMAPLRSSSCQVAPQTGPPVSIHCTTISASMWSFGRGATPTDVHALTSTCTSRQNASCGTPI